MINCIFCKIVKKELPSTVFYEDDDILAFQCKPPIAPVHVLLIPKKHIESINDIVEEDANLMGKMILIAKNIAKDLGISEEGYKLLFRVGKNGGQEVLHIHLHLIGGAALYEEIRPIE